MKDIQTELDKPGVNSFGLGDFKAPKVLGDILESIAGAAFLDTALNTDQVWKVRQLLPFPTLTEVPKVLWLLLCLLESSTVLTSV